MIWFWLPEIRGSWAKRIIPLSPPIKNQCPANCGAFLFVAAVMLAFKDAKNKKWPALAGIDFWLMPPKKGFTGKQSEACFPVIQKWCLGWVEKWCWCRKRFAFTLQHPADIYTALCRPFPLGSRSKRIIPLYASPPRHSHGTSQASPVGIMIEANNPSLSANQKLMPLPLGICQ